MIKKLRKKIHPKIAREKKLRVKIPKQKKINSEKPGGKNFGKIFPKNNRGKKTRCENCNKKRGKFKKNSKNSIKILRGNWGAK